MEKYKYLPHVVFLVGVGFLTGCGEGSAPDWSKLYTTYTPNPNAQIDDQSGLIDTTVNTLTPSPTNELPIVGSTVEYIVPTVTPPILDTPIAVPVPTDTLVSTNIPTPTATNTPTVTSTPLPALSSSEISGTTRAQVGGTVAAWTRTPESYATEMETLPENLRRSAVSVTFAFADGSVSGGSGAIIGYNAESGIAYGVTAAHMINNPDILTLTLTQPHIDIQSSVEISNRDFSTVWQSPDGLCVFAFRHPDAFRLGSIGEENVDVNWIPDSNEDMFSLGFPSYIDNETNELFRSPGFPAVHHVVGEVYYDASINALVYFTDGQSAVGGSGTIIVNADGMFVGIVLAVSVDNSFIYSLDERYYDMVDLAVSNLESK